MKRRTKIVCTIGPASSSRKILRGMIAAGMDVARLNFSHGTHEEKTAAIQAIREISEELGIAVGILADLPGPKIRLGTMAAAVTLKPRQCVTLTPNCTSDDGDCIPLPIPALIEALRPGDRVFINDGIVYLRVKALIGDGVLCQVVVGGEVSTHKGVAAPDTRLDLPAITDADLEHAAFAVGQGVDWIAVSFVCRGEDALRLRAGIRASGGDQPIIAKVERREAVANIAGIIEAFDGVMVARGDLGVEMPIEEVPSIQKDLIARCSRRGKVVITATQMLESMMSQTRPTRAEVTDVANAVFDGTDATMLSGETAAGEYPVETVRMMSRIIRRAERDIDYVNEFHDRRPEDGVTVTDAIASGTVEIAHGLGVAAILAVTASGHTAKAISKLRPKPMLVGAAMTQESLCRLKLSWGVYPVLVPKSNNTDTMIEAAVEGALSAGYIKRGDQVVITAGAPLAEPGTTNLLKVVTA